MNLTNEVQIIPVSYTDAAAISLIKKLDAYQINLYGLASCNLDSIAVLQQTGACLLGAYLQNTLAGIGAIKLVDDYAEVKRMFVDEAYRGLGIATDILLALEHHAWRNGRKTVNLETGFLQGRAIRFYQKSGYSVVKQFGNYQPNKVSVYLSKTL